MWKDYNKSYSIRRVNYMNHIQTHHNVLLYNIYIFSSLVYKYFLIVLLLFCKSLIISSDLTILQMIYSSYNRFYKSHIHNLISSSLSTYSTHHSHLCYSYCILVFDFYCPTLCLVYVRFII